MVVKLQHDIILSNYSDLTRPSSPKWWFSKGNPLISGKSRLVKHYNLARYHILSKFGFHLPRFAVLDQEQFMEMLQSVNANKVSESRQKAMF